MIRRSVVGMNRFVALVLACAWLAGAAGGIVIAVRAGPPWLALPSLFALVYGVLWLRVFVQSRLLAWSDLAMPWRGRSPPGQGRTSGGMR
ncbi:MAG TPA: hypothetical protein VLG08_09940 [Casimicrobiaceae bacterium]|jgi:hypothetical protein|nr:hypothetical protein [Casimicrobiaceae bacterium]